MRKPRAKKAAPEGTDAEEKPKAVRKPRAKKAAPTEEKPHAPTKESLIELLKQIAVDYEKLNLAYKRLTLHDDNAPAPTDNFSEMIAICVNELSTNLLKNIGVKGRKELQHNSFIRR